MQLPSITKSELTNYQYSESINTDLVIKILSQPELIHDTDDWDETASIKKLIKFSKNNKLNVKYGYSKKGVKYFGRIQPIPWNSLGVIRNEIRGTLCYNKYIDCDVVNAQPEMINQLLIANGMCNNEFNKYCSNRDECLQKIMDIYTCDRTAAKTFYIMSVYGSSFKSWCEKYEITMTKEIALWMHIKNEATHLANHFIAENNDLYNKYKKVKVGQFNYKLGFLSKCLQHFEVKVLELMFKFFMENGFINKGPKKNAILCHDGIMIKKTDRLTPKIFDKLNDYIFNEIKFKLIVKKKEMSHYLDRIKEPEIKDCVSSSFDIDYMATLPFYSNKKDYFEKYHAKLIREGSYINMIESSVGYKKHNAIKDTYGHLSEKNMPQDEEYDPDAKIGGKFIKKWLDDSKIKTYNTKEYNPYNGTWKGMNEGKIFNTFSGYSEHIHADAESIDDIKDIILNLCEGVPTYYDFMVRWLAHIIQFPNEKLPYAIVTNGTQGTGKGFLFKLMESVLGDNSSTSDKIETYLGKHAVGIQNKLFINFNECSSSSTRNLEAGIKSLITEDTSFIQPKYEMEHKIRNIARVWVTGNYQNTIKLDATNGERRFLAFRATDKYTNCGGTFWGKMFDSIKRPGVISAWYQYLNSFDLSSYNFEEKRKECLSETYKNMIASNTPLVCSFLSDYTQNLWAGEESTDNHKIGKADFYRKYKAWHKLNGGENTIYTTKRFWHLLVVELQMPIEFKRTNSARWVEFDRNALFNFMTQKNWMTPF